MRAIDIFGFLGGAATAAVGVHFAPTAAHDPQEWGYCGIRALYPIRLSEKVPVFGLDSYVCVPDPLGIVMLVAYLSVVFFISGAFATRIGKKIEPIRGACAVALAIGLSIADMLLPFEGIDAVPTFIVGVALAAGAIATAYAGGIYASRNSLN